ncbi:hypothetical protein GCM10023115_28180 [Pontixanthobacter gangjinensis]|uniref:DUF2779 domain-containing protein n=1 Tax=Christiangramia aestuarii TaxID=1028746 RepID=A0A7K1LND3_9FLAO|nr:DUF2779 domain-containing protein [Christiangramia aestuarii]MUP42050.1 DUF2779 domain-containing protein [Christiangramia aestuarii]
MSQRLLTKSRFKLALECPNKLYYTRKSEYANQQLEDPFLEALAHGGFQVEELARLEYPEGELIENNDWDYNLLVEQTEVLLERDNVVIFEAAFRYQNLFIRTDILVKTGNNIKLIEVKAKSFDPDDEYLLIGKRGGLVSGWKPYLFDVAFQRYVIHKCHPEWNIKSYLKLADKSKVAKIDGLNQLFRITKQANNRTGIIRKVDSLEETGGTVLGDIKIDEIVNGIEAGKYRIYEDLCFEESIKLFSDYYQRDQYLGWPVSWACKSCEFKTTPEQEAEGLKSGFKECFQKQLGWKPDDFKKPTSFEIWNFRRGSRLFEEGKIHMDLLDEEDIGLKENPKKFSGSHRQWTQIEKSRNRDYSAIIFKEELKREMDTWKFPLNFIDFETSMSALPFNKGKRPYEQIAFQFSHHTVSADGTIEHASEYINFEPGKFPNFEFVRELKKALSQNSGSIFRYSNHENSVLNQIYQQLCDSNETDKEELKTFIRSITKASGSIAENWIGERNMIDLCEVIKDYYYNLHMGGSNSIKTVLPAALKTSKLLQEKYSKPISEIGMSSNNFQEDHSWLQIKNGEIQSPYKSLPPLFEDWDEEQLDATVSEMGSIADGGAALTAYGKLQYTDMPEEERLEIKNSLLKYCELDTLAMVMIYEHLRELTTS